MHTLLSSITALMTIAIFAGCGCRGIAPEKSLPLNEKKDGHVAP